MAISTTTRTGQALARERFGANRVFYCPLDLPWAVRAYLNALKPRMLVLAETEFWPNLLDGCFRRGIPVAVVNARISDRSWPRYKMLRRLWKPLLGRLGRCLAQSQTDAERLIALGCAPERVVGGGESEVRCARGGRGRGHAAVEGKVGGGCVLWLRAARWKARKRRCWRRGRKLLHRRSRSWRWFLRRGIRSGLQRWRRCSRNQGIAWTRRSEWSAKPAEPLRPGEIVLLDTIGELASVYSLASVAFVGGSLVPAGGHNPLEPAQFGVPIVMGPHYANFVAIADSLRAHDALRIAAKEELAEALAALLGDRTAAEAMGARAREVFEQQAGATDRCAVALRALLASRTEPERKP